MAVGALPGAAEAPLAESAAAVESGARRALAFSLVGAGHLVNHVQQGMVTVLYPLMMRELGFGYFEIGLLQTTFQMTSQGCQIAYGFLGRFWPRALLLGVANIVMGIFNVAMGVAQNFPQLMGTRLLSGAGTSAQHPLGQAILVSHFPEARARILTLHASAGQLGSLVAPALLAALLAVASWRTVLYVLSVPAIVMGLCFFFLRDVVAPEQGSRRQRAKASLREYLDCLKNRNVMMISLVQMTGAAGMGTGINAAYLVTFFIAAFSVDVMGAAWLMAVYQVGGLLGPICLGWLADRFSMKWVLQASLGASTVTTLWLLMHHSVTPALLLNLVLYGTMVNSRGSLTQAVVSLSLPMEQLLTGFSLYDFIGFISGPLWTLIMGAIIASHGFTWAFAVVSLSYLGGVALLCFTNIPRTGRPQRIRPR